MRRLCEGVGRPHERDAIPTESLPDGAVGRAGAWTVANRGGGDVRAVSSRCRHQLADLSKGSLDKDGCLVCPWHGSRYDLDSGEMVSGPKGFLVYVGHTSGYTQLVKAYGLRLRRRDVVRDGDDACADNRSTTTRVAAAGTVGGRRYCRQDVERIREEHPMATRDSGGQDRQTRKHEDVEEEQVEASSDVQERVGKLTDDIDALLDDIDEALEENAEEFVRGFVQKGGE